MIIKPHPSLPSRDCWPFVPLVPSNSELIINNILMANLDMSELVLAKRAKGCVCVDEYCTL